MRDALQAIEDYSDALEARRALQEEVDGIREEILGEKAEELRALEMEYGVRFAALDEAIGELAAMVKEYVLLEGESVRGSRVMASYVRGRVRVDMEALEELAREDVRVAETISVGDAYVTIRVLGG